MILTTTKVQKLTGISARKLRWWDRIGLVKPSASPEGGRWRRYALQDIVCLLVVKTLREKGISIQKIRQSVKRIQGMGIHHPLAELRVACLAHSVIFKKDGKFLELSGQMVISEALEEIRPHLNRRRFPSLKVAVIKSVDTYLQKVGEF